MLSVGIGLMVYVPVSLYLEYAIEAGELESQRNNRLERSGRIIQALYKAGFQREATSMLNSTKFRGDLGYYALYRSEQLIKVDPPNENLVLDLSVADRKQIAGRVVSDEKRTEMSIILDDLNLLTIGREQKLLGSWIEVIYETGGWKFIAVAYLAILVAFWSSFHRGFSDIRMLARQLVNSRYNL